VSVDQMVDRVWATRRLPRRPERAVQHAMTLLRRALRPAADVTIARRSAGYQLTVDAETIDLLRFHAVLDHARNATDDDQAAALVEQALRLWRGEPFAGLRSPWLDALRATLGNRRQAAQLDLTDIRLRQGKHSALLADLAGQTEHQPLDERLAAQYLLALYRSGRQAHALWYYHHLRHRLAEELGADPGLPLQQLHHQILTASPGHCRADTARFGPRGQTVHDPGLSRRGPGDGPVRAGVPDRSRGRS
jgi:DNA-binding SARP family transcriptional activator